MLYNPELIKENCGFGLIANIDGKPSHKVVRTAMIGLARMQHRGAIWPMAKLAMAVAC